MLPKVLHSYYFRAIYFIYKPNFNYPVKKVYAFALLIFICYNASAQKYVPHIKEGTILNYNVKARATGQPAGISLTIISLAPPVKIKWAIPFVGTGFFEMSAKSIQSATKTLAEEPAPDEVTTMKDDETLLLLSKDTYNSMINNKSFQLNGYTFNVQTDTAAFQINKKDADVFYAVSTKGNRRIWVLNDPDFPLICRSKRVTDLIDFELTAITE